MAENILQRLPDWFANFLTDVPPWLAVLLVAMVPVLELRASIPLGFLFGLPVWETVLFSFIGNMLPAPFIILFARHILAWMKRFPTFARLAAWLERKAHKGAKKMVAISTMGLALFVAIPLPGTGAWTGSLIAAVLGLRMKLALPAVALGVLLAAIFMTLLSTAAVGILGF